MESIVNSDIFRIGSLIKIFAISPKEGPELEKFKESTLKFREEFKNSGNQDLHSTSFYSTGGHFEMVHLVRENPPNLGVITLMGDGINFSAHRPDLNLQFKGRVVDGNSNGIPFPDRYYSFWGQYFHLVPTEIKLHVLRIVVHRLTNMDLAETNCHEVTVLPDEEDRKGDRRIHREGAILVARDVMPARLFNITLIEEDLNDIPYIYSFLKGSKIVMETFLTTSVRKKETSCAYCNDGNHHISKCCAFWETEICQNCSGYHSTDKCSRSNTPKTNNKIPQRSATSERLVTGFDPLVLYPMPDINPNMIPSTSNSKDKSGSKNTPKSQAAKPKGTAANKAKTTKNYTAAEQNELEKAIARSLQESKKRPLTEEEKENDSSRKEIKAGHATGPTNRIETVVVDEEETDKMDEEVQGTDTSPMDTSQQPQGARVAGAPPLEHSGPDQA